ncbi:hypothetical protein LptCag_1101 [Leptospirillum ferriphilum]|uniref:Uncharacterized protein n=1 Tax=Leptospirillum ferriphilum TaxID=178606 RepID=A0A094W9W3_9BACT|nr:hypothetical protein LptCag_1101 [Leptospirillum ferriphilum]
MLSDPVSCTLFLSGSVSLTKRKCCPAFCADILHCPSQEKGKTAINPLYNSDELISNTDAMLQGTPTHSFS